jgi:hypothetical protein
MGLAQAGVDHPEVGLRREESSWDEAHSACFHTIRPPEPYDTGTTYTICVPVNDIGAGIVAEEVPEIECCDSLNCDLRHFVSPITTSGMIPRMLAGTGSSIWKQIWPGTSHRGSITTRASPEINGIGWFIDRLICWSFI